MSALTNSLKSDHKLLTSTLQKVKSLGIGSSEGQATLMSAKRALLAHLKKEDAQLYPALKKAAANDANLERTLKVFAKDMDGISRAALEFFKKYEHGGEGFEFAKDFGSLVAALSSRIRKEEMVLYAEYEKLQ